MAKRVGVELKDLIEKVADDLRAARNIQDPVLTLEECEMELAIESSNDAGIGVRVWVFELGGRHSKTNTNTVKVKFRASRTLDVGAGLTTYLTTTTPIGQPAGFDLPDVEAHPPIQEIDLEPPAGGDPAH